LVAHQLPRREGKFRALLQVHLIRIEGLDADFRPFGIQNERDVFIQRLPRLLQLSDKYAVGFICAVGKVDPCGVHAAPYHFLHDFQIVACRPQGGQYFRLSHTDSSIQYFAFTLLYQWRRMAYTLYCAAIPPSPPRPAMMIKHNPVYLAIILF
jgi:hypothetical protein